MTKLYGASEPIKVLFVPREDNEQIDMDIEAEKLKSYTNAHSSVSRVYDEIATESLNFVDRKNMVLYNEYIAVLSKMVGVEAPKPMEHISTENYGVVVANQDIALEGWLGNMWEKIKETFRKIYEAIKSFFTTYFTKLGRLQNRLKNLEKTLSETDKDIKQMVIDKDAPSGLVSKLKGFSGVNEPSLRELVKNSATYAASLNGINKIAADFAKAGIVDKDFISRIKDFKDMAVAATEQKNKNTQAMANGLSKADKSKLEQNNKDLTQIVNESTKAANEAEGEVTELAEGVFDDASLNKDLAEKKFAEFRQGVIESLKPVVGLKLASGKIIKKVETEEQGKGLTIESEVEGDDPKDFSLGNRASLLALVKSAQEVFKTAEKDAQEFAKTNDLVYEQINNVHILITDIDRVDPAKFGKYKKVLSEIIRERLNYMRQFFVSYGKISKGALDNGVEAANAVSDYAVLSLKYFG